MYAAFLVTAGDSMFLPCWITMMMMMMMMMMMTTMMRVALGREADGPLILPLACHWADLHVP